jgi:MoaA/NifB/PqqE/SkfB family radical SAM enzyme
MKLFSSFNQTKALMWKEQIDGILNNDFLPPVGAVIDLTNRCTLKCKWCNSQFYRGKEELKTSDVFAIIDMLSAWGVKSVCYAGGGEPSMHPRFADIIRYSKGAGLEVGISSNGVTLNKAMINAIGECAKFCGFSIDAGNVRTWCREKNSPLQSWQLLMKHARELCRHDLDTTYKFMVSSGNQGEIYQACKLAKKLGFVNFYARFPAFENVPDVKMMVYNERLVNNQIRSCLKMDNGKFHVYANERRGINKHYHKEQTFSKCRATPLIAVFCADGYCYPCIDLRGRKGMNMCTHQELQTFWNSKDHKKLINRLQLSKCPRCAFARYNEAIDAMEKDTMFRWFP